VKSDLLSSNLESGKIDQVFLRGNDDYPDSINGVPLSSQTSRCIVSTNFVKFNITYHVNTSVCTGYSEEATLPGFGTINMGFGEVILPNFPGNFS